MNSKLDKYLPLLMNMPLFSGIEEKKDMAWLMTCVEGNVREYRAGETIAEQGEDLYYAQLVISGTAQLFADGETKNVDGGQLIPIPYTMGATYVKAPGRAEAKTGCVVLSMRWMRMSQMCNYNCEYHRRFIENLKAAGALLS